MRSFPFALTMLALFATLAVLLILHRPSTTRIVVFSNLTVAQTQTVSFATIPASLEWKVEGEVQGTGTVAILDSVLHYTTTGRFSTNGTGDYYTTNATVVFTPHQPAIGKIQVHLRFLGIP